MKLVFLLPLLLSQAPADGVPEAPPKQESQNLVTLEQALQNADQNQPLIREAVANTAAAQARVTETRGPLLPQLTATAAGSDTAIFTNAGSSSGSNGSNTNIGVGTGVGTSSGAVPTGVGLRATLGLVAYQLLWDFGNTLDRFRSYGVAARQYRYTEEETRVQAHLTTRSAYYNAHALKELVRVARETLENERKHLEQTEGMIKVGTTAEIALATEKTNYANDVFQVIQAEGNYATGRSLLNETMGIEGSLDYEVQALDAPPVPNEDQGTDELLTQALKARPAYAAIENQVEAQRLMVSSFHGAFWPTLYAQGGAFASFFPPSGTPGMAGYSGTYGGEVYGELALSWTLFNGLTNTGNVREQEADLANLEAQRDQLRQQIRYNLESARVAVASAKKGLDAASATVINAHEQLRLAEGQYVTGVGSVIQLGDAQVAYTTAEVQEVSAHYTLNNARATLMAQLGQG